MVDARQPHLSTGAATLGTGLTVVRPATAPTNGPEPLSRAGSVRRRTPRHEPMGRTGPSVPARPAEPRRQAQPAWTPGRARPDRRRRREPGRAAVHGRRGSGRTPPD